MSPFPPLLSLSLSLSLPLKPLDVTLVDLDSGEIRSGETVILPTIPSDLLTPVKTALIKVNLITYLITPCISTLTKPLLVINIIILLLLDC